MEVFGQTVRLFLVEGTATGIITAEIMNWTGHLLACPRSKLPEALSREEARRTGVYILVGDDPEIPNKVRLYIGEGDSVSERLKSHAKDPVKDFWTRAFLVSSKDTNLTKSHVRYLENRLVMLAKSAGRAVVANGNEPSVKSLPESDIADMEYFLRQILLILPVVGVDAFRPKVQTSPVTSEPSDHPVNERLELSLVSKKHSIVADAIENDGEITVLAGSTATTKDQFTANQYGDLRTGLIESGVMRLDEQNDFYRFTEDTSFKSPSAAAAVIFNRSANGRTSWRLKSTGQTLKDWQDLQLDSVE